MGSIYKDLGVSLRWELETGAGRGVRAEPSSSYVVIGSPVLLPAQGRTLSPQQSTLASCCSSSLQAMLGWMRFTARALFSA